MQHCFKENALRHIVDISDGQSEGRILANVALSKSNGRLLKHKLEFIG